MVRSRAGDQLIKGAVNYAFAEVASGAWQCHPEHLRIAKSLYGKSGTHKGDYVMDNRKRRKVVLEGYPGTGASPADGQRVTLETAPF